MTDHLKGLHTVKEGERLKLTRELRNTTKQIRNLTNAIAERGTSRSLHEALHNAEIKEASLRLQIEQLERDMLEPQTGTHTQLAALAAELKTALHSEDLTKKKHAIHMLTVRVVAIRTDAQISSVLNYLPANVCIGGGTPIGVQTEDIQFFIIIPKYAPRPK